MVDCNAVNIFLVAEMYGERYYVDFAFKLGDKSMVKSIIILVFIMISSFIILKIFYFSDISAYSL